MSLLSALKTFFSTADSVKKVSVGEELVVLVSVAREDKKIRDQLIAILEQEPFQRQSLLNTWLTQLRLERAPAPILAAVSQLTDQQTADKTLELLTA